MRNRCRRIYTWPRSAVVAYTCLKYLLDSGYAGLSCNHRNHRLIRVTSLSDSFQIIESQQVLCEIAVVQKRKVDKIKALPLSPS